MLVLIFPLPNLNFFTGVSKRYSGLYSSGRSQSSNQSTNDRSPGSAGSLCRDCGNVHGNGANYGGVGGLLHSPRHSIISNSDEGVGGSPRCPFLAGGGGGGGRASVCSGGTADAATTTIIAATSSSSSNNHSNSTSPTKSGDSLGSNSGGGGVVSNTGNSGSGGSGSGGERGGAGGTDTLKRNSKVFSKSVVIDSSISIFFSASLI